jgi:protein tyrosine phosphatase
VRAQQTVLTEYERLRRARVSGTYHAALSVGNERRNRYSNVLPFDANRVRLGSAKHDYINASLLQSLDDERPAWRYIATQVRGAPSRKVSAVHAHA